VATEVKLIPEDAETFQKWSQASTTEQHLVLRARVILAAARHESTTRIAARERVRAATVSKWDSVMLDKACEACTMPRGQVRGGVTIKSPSSGCSSKWTNPLGRVTRAGMGACWPRRWAMSPPSRCGGS
jgi:hypothetical protein